jgi:cation-transporting ATPase 13A1
MTQINLLRTRHLLMRTDVLAFLVIYGILLPLIYSIEPVEPIYIKFFFVVLFFFNCLFLFVCETNQRFKAEHRFTRVTRISEASHVDYINTERSGKVTHHVVPLEKTTLTLSNGSVITVNFFFYRKLKFYFDIEEKKFRKVKPALRQPIETLLDRRPSFYHAEIEKLLMDRNQLKFPLPDFMQIFKEQLMDPLNFFQIFSVMLWFFDDNFYHPLMMLFLLIISNLTVCFQRISTIMNLRSLQTKPYAVQVLDKATGAFVRRSSEDLFPGDIVLVQRTNELTPFDNTPGAHNDNDFDEIRKMIPFGEKIPEDFLRRLIFKNNMPGGQPQTGAGAPQKEQSKLVNSSDLLILEGNAAVDESILTGESLPQVKDPLDKRYRNEIFDKKTYKNSVIFAGTDVLQVSCDSQKRPIAIVLNTGFYTTKGKLARTVLFNEENNAVSQREAYALLFLLLLVSLVTSIYVLLEGLQDEERNKDKLFIRCILIVTTVVPPELPMIMAMAVNASLMYLRKKRLFCTEPFRIPLAGKIDTCVFDKTGTLTRESLLLKGIAYPLTGQQTRSESTQKNDNGLQTEHVDVSKEIHCETDIKNEGMPCFDKMSAILAGCQSLIEVDRVLQGDPIELLFFTNSDFRYHAGAKQAVHAKNTSRTLSIRKVFSFNSELKRMSAIVRLNNFGSLGSGDYLVSKGAPEVMLNFFNEKIPRYNEWLSHYAAEGYRLLSLGIRKIKPEELNADDREIVEKDLDFVGFLILANELKSDSVEYVQRLKDAGRGVVILTGDHLLTSMKAYQNLFYPNDHKKKHAHSIATNKFGVISYNRDSKKRVLLDQRSKPFPQEPTNQYVSSLKDMGYSIGISGADFDDCLSNDRPVLPLIDVVARVNPKQKEAYILALKSNNKKVLMCGDGTNDVGALKAADIGIALVGTKNEPTREEKLEKKRKREEAVRKALMERRMPKPSELATEEEPEFKLGDASIAAPFTNKHSNSIKCVETVLKQGICTLTCSIQSYKIVTLSSLLTAYSLSTLHLENLKFSDMQNTMMGIYGAYLYYQLSNGKPTKHISRDRPPSTIFNTYFWLSLAGQLVLQLSFTFMIMRFAKDYAPPEQQQVDNEDEFIPTFMNSVMFLFNLASMFCISIFNYEGRPFMMSLSENKKHFKFLIAPLLLILILAFDLSDDVAALFQTTLKTQHENSETILSALLFGFIGLSYLWTLFTKYLHYRKIEKWI